MPKRSSKRRLNGVKLRRFHLGVHPEVGDMFEDLAGGAAFNVAFEEIVKYVYRKKKKHEENTHSSAELPCEPLHVVASLQ